MDKTINLNKMASFLGSNNGRKYKSYTKEEIQTELAEYEALKIRAINEKDEISLLEIEEEIEELKSY